MRMRSRGKRRAAFGVSFALSIFLATIADHARANGRFPAATQLAVSPTDSTLLALRTTFGVLISHDAGGTWGWVCEHAVGYGDAGVEDPTLAMFPSAMMAGIAEGIAVSRDDGCGWSLTSNAPIVDVAVRPNAPLGALALTSRYPPANAPAVLETIDEGAHWIQKGVALAADHVFETVDVSVSDTHRIYLSGSRAQTLGDGAIAPLGFLLVSFDDGAHYAEHAIDLDPATETAPFIAAIDPANAARVYLRIKGSMGSRIVVTDDAGATFRTVFKGQGELLGFALSEAGDKVYVGGPLDGISMATRDSLVFVKKSDAELQCLTRIGNSLYACMSDPHAFADQLVATSIDDGVTFVPKFHLACLEGALACPSSSAAASCAADFAQVQALLAPLSCDPGDAQSPVDSGDSHAPSLDASSPIEPDASTPIASPRVASPSSACGCTLSDLRGSRAMSAFVMISLITVFMRRARPR